MKVIVVSSGAQRGCGGECRAVGRSTKDAKRMQRSHRANGRHRPKFRAIDLPEQ
jgi:hypothetical protein